MPKTFSSLSEAISYIKKAQKQTSKEIGLELEKIMKETTQRNLYDSYSPSEYSRTGDMLKMIRLTECTSDSVKVEIEDTGGHKSWSSGRNVYVAPILEEGGHTYEKGGRRKPPTRIIEDSLEEAEKIIPNEYIKSMSSRGIKVNKK